MAGLRPGVARCGRLSGLATVAGLLLLAACTSAHPAAVAGPTASATAAGADGSGIDCDSVATCYTPQQLQVAYGVKPLLDRGIDGRGETVVLPELAESRVDPM